MKFTEFTEGDNKKVTDETIVNEAEPAFKLDIDIQAANDNFRPTPANTDKAPTTTKSNVVDLNQYRDELKKLDNAGQKELQNYSSELIKKMELIVLNKIDLLEEDVVKKKIKDFSKNKKCEVLTLSTLEKNSVSKIKSKLVLYAS